MDSSIRRFLRMNVKTMKNQYEFPIVIVYKTVLTSVLVLEESTAIAADRRVYIWSIDKLLLSTPFRLCCLDKHHGKPTHISHMLVAILIEILSSSRRASESLCRDGFCGQNTQSWWGHVNQTRLCFHTIWISQEAQQILVWIYRIFRSCQSFKPS